MAFAESRSAFFTDFGVTATVGGVAVSAIFDAPYADALGMAGTNPTLTIDSDSVTPTYGAAVSVAGASFTIAEIHPDATGITRLILEAA